MIPPIYSSTTLKTDLKAVKEATQDSYAIVTDGSRGNCLFGAEPCIEDEFAMAAWEEANAERIIEGIERGRADFARGAYVIGTDAAIALSNKMRQERMKVAHG